MREKDGQPEVWDVPNDLVAFQVQRSSLLIELPLHLQHAFTGFIIDLCRMLQDLRGGFGCNAKKTIHAEP